MRAIGNLFVRVDGAGAPSAVLLLPGLGCGPSVYDDLAAALKDEHAVYSLTVAGFDGTPPAGPPLVDRTLSSLARLVHDEGLTRPLVVGHSLGGIIALKFAETHPALVGGVVALDAAPRKLGGETEGERRRANEATADGLFGEPDFRAEGSPARRWISQMVTGAAAAEGLSDAWVGADRAALREMFVEGRMLSLRLNVAAVRAPVCAVAAYETEAEREQVRGEFEEAYAGAPSATVKLIGPARHYVMLDQPALTSAAVLEFLRHVWG